jgi:tetratricopeptide (TPR) repeat protein
MTSIQRSVVPIAAVRIAILALWLAACAPADPNAAAAKREYFAALEGQEQWMPLEQQLAHVERAVELDPANPTYWQSRGGYKTSLGDLPGAEADFDRAIELRDQPYLRYQRGIVRCERSNYAAALADFDLAIAAQPANTQFYVERSIARVGAGRADDALADAELVISRSALWAEGYYARGVAHAALGKTPEAIADFSQVIQQRPELAYPFRARARAYASLGDRDAAARDEAEAARDTHWGSALCRLVP